MTTIPVSALFAGVRMMAGATASSHDLICLCKLPPASCQLPGIYMVVLAFCSCPCGCHQKEKTCKCCAACLPLSPGNSSPFTTWQACACAQVSAFYTSADPPRNLVRFCFCKTDEKLQSACQRLRQYFGQGPHQALANGAA